MIDFLTAIYEETRHKVVPPATIANNMRNFYRLIASNIDRNWLNSNRAGLDAQYQQYRAQNIAVMNDYQVPPGLSNVSRWQEPPLNLRGGGRVGPEGRGGTWLNISEPPGIY